MGGKSGRVSIISRESDERTLDVAMLEAELLRRGLDVKVLSRLLTKDRGLKSLTYAGEVLKQEAAILGSDVVVLDTYCIPASMFPHRSGTKVIQIWHALAAVKKFGWQTVGREGGSSGRTARLMRMHRGYDHIACASDVTAEHFCEAFGADASKVVKLGLPRIDYIKSVAAGDRKADTLRRIYSRYPQLKKSKEEDHSKKLILYAPTFRRGRAVDVKSLADAIDPSRYDLVVRLHPLYREDVEKDILGSAHESKGEAHEGKMKALSERIIIFDDDIPTFDWLAAADMVISDYSSFVIESTLADVPLYIYAYDLEDYDENTGLNTDFDSEPIAPYVFRDARSLAETLGKDYDMKALRAFRERYIDIDHEKKSCTEQMADFIESLMRS